LKLFLAKFSFFEGSKPKMLIRQHWYVKPVHENDPSFKRAAVNKLSFGSKSMEIRGNASSHDGRAVHRKYAIRGFQDHAVHYVLQEFFTENRFSCALR